MNRTLYDTNIKAIKINERAIRISTDDYSGGFVKHNVMPKEWDFLEDVLGAFAGDENPVTAIVRMAKEYKGYG